MYVARPVEGIVAVEHKAVDLDVFAVHGEVVALCRNVFKRDVVAGPQRLSRIGQRHVAKRDAGAAAEVLWGFDDRVLYQDVVGIPHARARHFEPRALARRDMRGVPQRVLPAKRAPHKLDVRALLEGGLAVGKDGVDNTQVMGVEQGALPAQKLLVNLLGHGCRTLLGVSGIRRGKGSFFLQAS